MIITNCNKCNKVIKNDEVFQDYNHENHCEKCHLKNKLKDVIARYNEKKRWLKETHLKHLMKLQREISVLKMKIGLLQ